MRRVRPTCLAAVLLACLGALPVAQAPTPAGRKPPTAAAARAERVVPFKPGETLTYDVSWSSYLTAGTAVVSVREKKPSFGSVAYYIVAEGQPVGLVASLFSLYYKADTLLDVYSLLPQRGAIYSREGRRQQMKVTRFDHAARKATYEVQTATTVTQTVPMLPRSQDALSAFFLVRTHAMEPGARFTIPVVDSGDAFKVQVTVADREPVRSGIGTLTAWKVTPVILDQHDRPTSDRQLALWLTDDARRLPVKLQADLGFGTFDLTLRDARQAGR
jgi:hypothetical protein